MMGDVRCDDGWLDVQCDIRLRQCSVQCEMQCEMQCSCNVCHVDATGATQMRWEQCRCEWVQ